MYTHVPRRMHSRRLQEHIDVTTNLRWYHRYKREIPEPAPFLSWRGTQIGWSAGSSHNQNNHGLSGALCHLHLLRSEHEDQHMLNATRCTKRSWTHLFLCALGKNPNNPNLCPVAVDAITRGGIRGLGSPLYICGWYKL